MEKNRFIIFKGDAECWISNGDGMWPTDGMEIQTGNIQALFDIPSKKMDSILVQEMKITDERMCLEPIPGEEKLTLCGYIYEMGELYSVLQDKHDKVWLVNTALLKPAERRNGELRFFLRRGDRGNDLIVGFGDMLAWVIVAPVDADIARGIMYRTRTMANLPLEGDD